MGDESDPLLTVRETAKRLQVHENTVRNWAAKGTLQSAGVPGGTHRFRASEVDRLVRQRGARVASVEHDRRAAGPELVDATQLAQWAASRDAQGRFPELVRRLLAATPGVTQVLIRAGDGVALEGWDGLAESTGTTFLPAGRLRFEFGVDKDRKGKADREYQKRLKEAGPDEDLGELVFVFCTPRRWAGGDEWARARREEGKFANVHVLDADALEGWLQATPSVHVWISEHLDRRPRDAESLDRWWARFQSRTSPNLSSAFLLAGREEEAGRLERTLTAGPAVIAVKAAWRDEAVAFLAAAIEARMPEAPIAVVVSSAAVWDRVIAESGRATLVPVFDGADFAGAQVRGHHVVVPVGRNHVVDHAVTIDLPPVGRQQAITALQELGVAADRAYTLSALARRSMPSLVRELALDPAFATPPWARTAVDTAILTSLALIGAWTANPSDLSIIERMTGRPWADVESVLLHWQNTEDPPFVRSGTQWHAASAHQIFHVLHPLISVSVLERWRQTAIDVLLGAGSGVLRRGLASGLALMGAEGDRPMPDGSNCADQATRVAALVLRAALEDETSSTWSALTDVLPLIAEAAPDVFLASVHDDLDRKDLLGGLFQDSDGGFGASPHTGLLWALETVCWHTEHLIDGTFALARLDSIDPGGRTRNRPLESLASILACRIRHTAAPVETKAKAVSLICRRRPEIGWRTVLALLPSPHRVITPPASPVFRDWRPEDQTVTLAELISYVGSLMTNALEAVGADAGRWIELIGHIWALPPGEQTRLLDALSALADDHDMPISEQARLWEKLRAMVANRKRFGEARQANDWVLARLRDISVRLEPVKGALRLGYLFDWQPDLPGLDVTVDYKRYIDGLVTARRNAVIEVLAESSLDGVRQFAGVAPVPNHLGLALGEVASDELTPSLLEWLDSSEPPLRDVAAGWAQRKLIENGPSWLHDVLLRPEMEPHARRLAFMLNAPPRREIWDVIAVVDPALHTAYWESMSAAVVAAEDLERAVEELVRHGRPWTALDLLQVGIHSAENHPLITSAMVRKALDGAMVDDTSAVHSPRHEYGVGRLIDYLAAQDTDLEIIARYEFAFARVTDDRREKKALYSVLGRDPDLFAEIVSYAYKGKNETRRQLDDGQLAVGILAFDVLSSWSMVPGTQENGAIDGEHLRDWVQRARLRLTEIDRGDVGDEIIGQILSASPDGADGSWPAEEVREVIDGIGSPGIDSGLYVGILNRRGMTSRGVFEGGQQERDLADKYRDLARRIAGDWPRTARVLRGVADTYERRARSEDAEAGTSADTE
ncbi:helix-turn-helix domain-containing protein [Sphaerisporangium sp. NPDC051017]|uniref:helix-turn-helix domain-containing protein n=1 Tax=Sphaerisporangium sp. NPDC051017 TaxID=3154636 RepID=UPI003412A899